MNREELEQALRFHGKLGYMKFQQGARERSLGENDEFAREREGQQHLMRYFEISDVGEEIFGLKFTMDTMKGVNNG